MSNSTENAITCIFLTKHLANYKKMLTFAHIIKNKEWRWLTLNALQQEN